MGMAGCRGCDHSGGSASLQPFSAQSGVGQWAQDWRSKWKTIQCVLFCEFVWARDCHTVTHGGRGGTELPDLGMAGLPASSEPAPLCSTWSPGHLLES